MAVILINSINQPVFFQLQKLNVTSHITKLVVITCVLVEGFCCCLFLHTISGCNNISTLALITMAVQETVNFLFCRKEKMYFVKK